MPFNDERAKLVTIHNAVGLMRNTDTGVIINTNEAEYNLMLEQRKHAKDMQSIQEDFNELKEMVRKLAK